MLQQLQVSGDGEDVHEMEEDIHNNYDPQVSQALQADVPHLPLFPGQVWLIGLQGAAHPHMSQNLQNKQNPYLKPFN